MLITRSDDERLKAGGISGTEPTYLLRDSLRAALRAALAAKEDLETQVKTLEECLLKGVAFRDGLQANIGELEGKNERWKEKCIFLDGAHKRMSEAYDIAFNASQQAEGALCSMREAFRSARTLNGTECLATGSGHLPIILQKRGNPVERCGRCLYCIIDAALSSSSPCPHEAGAKRLREALEKIADYDWVKGGRIIFGNEELPGDAGQFYRGYNAGIKGQFEATKAIADAELRRRSDAGREGK